MFCAKWRLFPIHSEIKASHGSRRLWKGWQPVCFDYWWNENQKWTCVRKHTEKLVGFCDFGMVNQQMEELAATAKYNRNPALRLAEQMLIFMVRPIFRPSLSFMVASYVCFTGFVRTKAVCPCMGLLKPWSLVVYQFSPWQVLMPHQIVALTGCVAYIKDKTHKTWNPFANRDPYFFCDPPHLLKTARNCLSNSGAHSKSESCGQWISVAGGV